MIELDGPNFTLALPMRCHHLVGPELHQVCGQLARWTGLVNGSSEFAYFCELHRRPHDLVIPETHSYRRISIEVRLLMASASRLDDVGRLEAIARLDQVLEAAGAVPDWLGVRSMLGRFSPRAAAGQGRGNRRGG